MRAIKLAVISATLLAVAGPAFAQTPTPTPNTATRPPATETQNPTAAPASQQQPAQAPPGEPQVPRVTTQAPAATPSPSPEMTPNLSPETTPAQEPREPVFPTSEPKPIPPLPSLNRLGVVSNNTVPLSLNEAVKRALENNPDIEVARDDVRFAETQLRALEGVYDPVFSITPQLAKSTAPQQSVLGGSGRSGTTTSTTYTFSPSLTRTLGEVAAPTRSPLQTSTRTPVQPSVSSIPTTRPIFLYRSLSHFFEIVPSTTIVGRFAFRGNGWNNRMPTFACVQPQ